MLVHMNSRTQHQKPSARRIAAFAALPIVAALTLTGCASDDSDDDTGSAGSGSVGSSATDPAGTGTGTGTGSSSSGSASVGSNTALLAAVATARGEVGSGTVISVEQEQGASAYEVLVVTKDGTEHEVHTNADGTSVAGTPQTEAADVVVWEGDVLDSSGTKHSVRIDAGSGDVVTDRVVTDD